jgi:replicative DNA helicase
MNEVIRDYEAVIANNIAFIDKPVSPVDIAVLVGRVERELGVKPIVFLDYIQITPQSSERSFVDERSAVKETVAGLRRIVNGHNVPLFAISSINRSNYKKDSAGLDALAESSSLEYAADSVLFLSVKGKGDERLLNMKQQERPVTITMLKNRYGVTGSANLVFDTSFALFREV